MEAIGLNPIRLDAIGIDPIRLNAIRLGVPGASSGSSGRPYIDPEVLASLVAVCICDGKSNNDPDRAVIKNLVDPANPFVISNAAYKLNSGFGKYEEDFTNWKEVSGVNISSDGTKIKVLTNNFSCQYNYSSIGRDVPSFKVKISNFTEGTISYYYREEDGNETHINFGPITVANSNGIVELPKSYNTVENGTGYKGGFIGIQNTNIGLTIEQIPSFQGALVTDGVNDLITSTKTVQEMLGGSTKVTVVSMIANLDEQAVNYINNLSLSVGNYWKANTIPANRNNKCGIFGYSSNDINSAKYSVINNILGDKNDYSASSNIVSVTVEPKFYVQGLLYQGKPTYCRKYAYYWTFIAKRTLTTDETNQVIAYYNLDKYVKPDIYYDVKRQGLSNNTPDADWYLKDFSGNGRDMQLYNFAKKLGSGVGKYAEDFKTWYQMTNGTAIISHDKLRVNKVSDINGGNFIAWKLQSEIKAFKAKITGIPKDVNISYIYSREGGVRESIIINTDGEYDLPYSHPYASGVGFAINGNFPKEAYIGVTIEQIPDYEGALVFDAVEDYGQFIGNLGLKDYTVAVDRAYPSLKGNGVPIISSINGNTVSPFLFEFADNTGVVRPYSFGATTVLSSMELNRKISYQSTYIYDGTAINKGLHDNTGNGLTIGRFGIDTQYANIALWSLLLFPYTLSEFLLERQLKKYKLGTLYPDMVELRPIVKSNMGYLRIEYRNGKGGLIKSGTYLPIGGILRVIVVLNNTVDEVSLKINGEVVPLKPEYSANGFWTFDYIITKSPQKIDITIDEYIRFEDIVQPYPAIVNIPKVDGGYYTYGDKIPVGYRFRRESAINLLPELYSLSDIFLNGELCNVGAEIVISKSMVFTANKAWLLDTTEPHAIYSPQKLNIPNSSLKILGYVPDLTGKGNHGKLNNFAYTEDSGVAADGSIKFDGTDDRITIPTLAHGGKCVMMKVNWTKAGMLYDQRLNSSFYLFGIYTSEGLPAYNARNNGSTYIDGILNTNIIPSDLVGITHNITVVNDKATDDNTISPILGASVTNATFSGMFLYEFMLFHEIPSEDEIKKLNDVMGIEGGYVESPNYYFDAYGKANSATLDIDYVALNQASDAHKRLIDKSRAGLAALELYHNTGIITELNNRTLKVNNFAFNEESGYGGWLGIGDLTKSFNESYVTNNWKRGGTFIKGKTSSGSSIGYALANWYDVTNHILKFKIKITGLTDNDTLYIRQYNVEPIISQQLFNGINEVTLDLSASPSPTYRYINFNYSSLTNDVDFEFLYEYPNGLVSDGVEDYLSNTAIPAFTDFTVITKRIFIGNQTNYNAFCVKGDKVYSGGVGNAFAMEYHNTDGSFVNIIYGNSTYNAITPPELISYLTPTNYNGKTMTKGTGSDNLGLLVGRANTTYWKGVFYKMMLYSKTIDQLSINMLKNLFAKDELIDVNNPIFKK